MHALMSPTRPVTAGRGCCLVLLFLAVALFRTQFCHAEAVRPPSVGVRLVTLVETRTFTHAALVTRTVTEPSAATSDPLAPTVAQRPGSPPPAVSDWRGPVGWAVGAFRWLWAAGQWSLSLLLTVILAAGHVVWSPVAWTATRLLGLAPLFAFFVVSTFAGVVLGGLVAWACNLIHPAAQSPPADTGALPRYEPEAPQSPAPLVTSLSTPFESSHSPHRAPSMPVPLGTQPKATQSTLRQRMVAPHPRPIYLSDSDPSPP